MKNFIALIFSLLSFNLMAQPPSCYWQQRVEYKMDINLNVETNQFTGKQQLVYFNNSPDTLKKVFYHLYFNAFQPGSMMDVRSRTIEDPDSRVKDRISKLQPDEIGFVEINSLYQDGKPLKFKVVETILEVELNEPLLPGKKVLFEMNFLSQVPIQIRRSGRDNAEGIRYSMTQWYPKMCEYDKHGWHANPYIGREFHGVFGNFEVKITLDSSYVIGGTGILQNPQEIGHGYQDKNKPLSRKPSNQLTWHFKAENVHDFAWAADPDYIHQTYQVENGPFLRFFFQGDSLKDRWNALMPMAAKCFEIMDSTFGKYPFSQYAVIQGGDGGMEYPMATLISGDISLRGLVSVTVHEAIHSWYQHNLATNEAKFPWMDEGFTSYAQDYVMDILYNTKAANPHKSAYKGYFNVIKAGKEEPLTTHADFYHTNWAYGVNAYSKGQVFLHQLSYIVGLENFYAGMKKYYNDWLFKHPDADDFKRIMEKVSGMELDWYFEQFIGSTNHIDYGIANVNSNKTSTNVTLTNYGNMPMPIDVFVKLKSGVTHTYHIPLQIMRGEKKNEILSNLYHIMDDWPWVYPNYQLAIEYPVTEIETIIIDATQRLADINPDNNIYPNQKTIIFKTQSNLNEQ